MDYHPCPLCNSPTRRLLEHIQREYLTCTLCSGIIMNRRDLPSIDNELFRYNEHNNDVNDPRYQKFVEPVVNAVLSDFNRSDSGLDYGAGTGPVISKMLTDKGYKVKQYDPFFHNHKELLTLGYDYIVCCEVVEHFHKPADEFQLLNNLLTYGGKLYIKTELFYPGNDFATWYYKNDPTHVFFYQEKTMEYIKIRFGFSHLEYRDKIIILTKGNKARKRLNNSIRGI